MPDIHLARDLIRQSKRLVIFTGAGVSADSGIPTFRSSGGDSFWGKYSPEQLATPEGFRADPELVYDWYTWRRSQLRVVQPNAAHQAIARWQAEKNAIVITQNIDGLHERLAPTARRSCDFMAVSRKIVALHALTSRRSTFTPRRRCATARSVRRTCGPP